MRNWLKCLQQNVLPIGRFVSCYSDDGGGGDKIPQEKYSQSLDLQAGRQMCEELSLTGNHCTARRHTVPGTKEENSGKVNVREVSKC